MIEFYIPLMAAITYNIYATIKVKKFAMQHRDEEKGDLKYLERISLYPVILIVCWSPKILTRTLYFFSLEYFWLFVIDSVFGGLLGFANSLVYGTNKLMIKNFWGTCCKKMP